MEIKPEFEEIEHISNKDYIANFIAQKCKEYASEYDEPYFFGKAPGCRYVSQFYLSRGLYSTEFMRRVADEFFLLVKEHIGHWDFQIAGQEWAAIPLVIGLPIYLEERHGIKINSFMIKSERKGYGLHNIFEGTPNEFPVLIVGDLCNSTNTYAHCHRVILFEKMQVLPYIFAVLNKYSAKIPNWDVEDRVLRRNIKPLSIVNRDDIDNAERRSKKRI